MENNILSKEDCTQLEECILRLHEVGVVKFGNFTLKSGMQSPIYFDLRIVVSYPSLLTSVSTLLWRSAHHTCTRLCGVAYTGIPLATAISIQQDVPMLVRRKESKDYGTKKIVEGVFSPGDSCLIVEDVLVSGTSVFETVETLRGLEMSVSEAVVFLDREQGGVENLRRKGINITPVITLTQMMAVLLRHSRVTEVVTKEVFDFIAANNKTVIDTKPTPSIPTTPTTPTPTGRLLLSYGERASLAVHPVAAKLLRLMEEKKTNVCVAADVDTTEQLLLLAEEVGDGICALKTHGDAMEDLTQEAVGRLRLIAKEKNFLLFEDRKFVDIGATVARQCRQQSSWADLVTAAPLGGAGVVEGLDGGSGVLLLAQMSSAGAHHCQQYQQLCLDTAKQLPHKVAGLVCQQSLTDEPGLVQLTPGVSLSASADALGQRYTTPDDAVCQRGADVIIVGRGIVQAADRRQALTQYKEEAYKAYNKRRQDARV